MPSTISLKWRPRWPEIRNPEGLELDADTKGDLYEGLLQKNAEDTKSGARSSASRVCRSRSPVKASAAYFRPSWTPFQADRGRHFSVIVDGVSV